ncbi:MAG: type II toxin-antitoxin system HicB family antitoxin [Planctomycetaceae bacterium]|nr:type II toxin-antitoxin system HicB family antitoxin [Planctomycetaceae bacterium]
MRNEFTAVIEKDGKWFVAYSPEVPGANGQGRTRGEALDRLHEAIDLTLEDRCEELALTSAEFEQFSEFVRQKMGNGAVESLEELVDLWRVNNPSEQELEESVRALEEGLADAAAGRVRPAEDVFRDLAARYGAELSE